MKTILILGAGKSSTILIEYLQERAGLNDWQLLVADAHPDAANQRLSGLLKNAVLPLDVNDEEALGSLVRQCDLTISLLPANLHIQAARLCLEFGKHFLTASYVDEALRSLHRQAQDKGLLFLSEMGLDPGIDHMSAMELIARLKAEGSVIKGFHSHCGGLVAPESDTNPWHYKISWNARNIVLAGKSGARFLENGKVREMDYTELFDPSRRIDLSPSESYAWYPNRDSLSYISIYGLDGVRDFVRTTLRHPDFCFGWKNMIDLRLTDEDRIYETDGLSVRDFFRRHLSRNGFREWLEQVLHQRFNEVKDLLEQTMQLMEAEGEARLKAAEQGRRFDPNMMIVDQQGSLKDINLNSLKTDAAGTVMRKMHEANLSLKLLFFLGLDSGETIDQGLCSAADVLQFILEKKLALGPTDKDMIVMIHEIDHEREGIALKHRSSLVVKGTDALRTAMATTVGLPLGIAASLLLQGKFSLTGVQIPILPEIYEPVLKELARHGIIFQESITEV